MPVYKIRFNYKFIPYIWFRVPKFIWSKTRTTKFHIDGWSDSGRRTKKKNKVINKNYRWMFKLNQFINTLYDGKPHN